MSWYGTHPIFSKEQARRLLPAGACRLCRYMWRCGRKRSNAICPNCGLRSDYLWLTMLHARHESLAKGDLMPSIIAVMESIWHP